MEYLDFLRTGWRHLLPLWPGLVLSVSSANAAELDVTVLDRHGRPVPNVAVFIETDPEERSPAPAEPAVMSVMDSQFAPALLVVQTGTRVRFPNNDRVAHHIYSFSSPNNFVLPMFKGSMKPQVEFQDAGVVTIGCNLHDHMIGYVLVVDSAVFGTTDLNGTARLLADNPEGLSVGIWSPRIRLDTENLSQTVKAGRSARLTFSLTEDLRVSHNDNQAVSLWHTN